MPSRRYTHGRKPKFIPAAVAANIGLGVARGAVRKYGGRVAGAAAATGVGAAILNRFRRKAGVKPKYRRVGLTTSQGADTTRKEVVVSSGRKLTTSQLVDRTVKAAMSRSVFFWRRYAVEATGQGFDLSLDQAISSAQLRRYFPLYLFDLTARPQNISNSVRDAFFGHRAYCDTTGADDGKIKWVSISGLTANATNSDYVQVAEGTNLSGGQSQGRSILNWVDIRAQIQGARNIPTKVTFQIVKMLDDELDPMPNGSYTTTGANSTPHQVFWQSQIAELTVNPIHTYTMPKKRHLQIIATKTFTFQPKESVDNDTRGQLFVLKWFNRVNQICNYNNSGVVNTDDATFNSRTMPVNVAGNTVSPYADTKDKMFLLVKGYAPIAASAYDANIHPSFELNCRMCHNTLV